MKIYVHIIIIIINIIMYLIHAEKGQLLCFVNNTTHYIHRYSKQEAAADFQPHLPHQVRRRAVSHSSLLHWRPSEQHPELFQVQKLQPPRASQAQSHPHGHLEFCLCG